MKKILILFFLFTQLVAYAQVVGTPYMQPSSTNGTAVVSAYACINDFNPGTPFNSIASGVLKVGTPVSGVTQSITATVIKTGTYNITTTTANGVTFFGSGTFVALGNQTIQLSATGTPTAKGNNTFILNTGPSCGCVRYTTLTGVYANVNGTLTDFGTHNLGADTSKDPKTYVVGNADGSGGTLGYLYQWGRKNDGHQLRNSPTQNGPVHVSTPAPEPKFINSGGNWHTTPDDVALWSGDITGGPNNPCPTGFRVPTTTQWGGIYKGSTSNGFANTATQNTWSWTGRGYLVGPLLYLPATGYRHQYDGSLQDVGNPNDTVLTWGNYWSCNFPLANKWKAFKLSWSDSGFLRFQETNSTSAKSTGHSVRCIAIE